MLVQIDDIDAAQHLWTEAKSALTLISTNGAQRAANRAAAAGKKTTPQTTPQKLHARSYHFRGGSLIEGW